MKYVLSALLLFTGSWLFAQTETPPEVLNLAEVQQKIGYPAKARDTRMQGKVIAKVMVDESGKVESAEVIESPSELLSDAVSNRVTQLKFRPARKDGKPIRSIVHVPFLFELPENGGVFTSLDKALEDPLAVVELDLSGQNISKLDPRVAGMRNLEKVNLDENAFRQFPSVLCRLPLLEEISIADNKLTSVPGKLRKLENLHFVDLRGNDISEGEASSIRESLEDVSEVLTD